MRDEDFSLFISEFGEKTYPVPVPGDSMIRWNDRLPLQLLQYWTNEGWGAYANGLFWVVDPGEYESIKEDWLRGTALEEVDEFHVVARSAFGKLFLWGTRTGASVTISPLTHSIACLSSIVTDVIDDPDDDIKAFFSGIERRDCDIKDENGKALFSRALTKLGPLNAGEIYGFEPALVLGGHMRLDNLAKLDLFVHFDILRSLADPAIPFANIDISKLK